MELIHKDCEHCGNGFDSKRKDKKYCSDRCKSEAWKAGGKKPLGEPFDITSHQNQPTQQASLFPSIVKQPERKLPSQIAPDAAFIIESLKTDKQDLRDTVKELTAELKTITKEKNDLEKELEKSRGALNAKPSALDGFASSITMDGIINLFKEAPAAYKAIRDEIRSQEQPPVAGLPEAQAPREQDQLATWLGTQPPDVQKLFLTMIQKIMAYKNPSMLKGMLNQLLQQTMRAA